MFRKKQKSQNFLRVLQFPQARQVQQGGLSLADYSLKSSMTLNRVAGGDTGAGRGIEGEGLHSGQTYDACAVTAMILNRKIQTNV